MIRPTLPLVSRIGYSPDSRWTSPSPPTSAPSPKRCGAFSARSRSRVFLSRAWTRATAPARTRARSCARSARRAGSAWAGPRPSAARSGRCSSSSCCWKSWPWPARRSGRSPAAGRPPTPSSPTAASACGARCCRRWRAATARSGRATASPAPAPTCSALKTQARRDGDEYVIRGHKIWSSHAGIATLRPGVRTDEPGSAPEPRLQHVRGAQRHAGDGHPTDHEPHRRGLPLRDLPRRCTRAGRHAPGPGGRGLRGAAQRSRLRPLLGALLQGAGAGAHAPPAGRVRQH